MANAQTVQLFRFMLLFFRYFVYFVQKHFSSSLPQFSLSPGPAKVSSSNTSHLLPSAPLSAPEVPHHSSTAPAHSVMLPSYLTLSFSPGSQYGLEYFIL